MINYELKHTEPAKVSVDTVANTGTVVQGFTTGAVGVPDSYGMVAGDSITVVVTGWSAKTTAQADTEVITAVNAFIAAKYPPTA
jgi:hypothetical protein